MDNKEGGIMGKWQEDKMEMNFPCLAIILYINSFIMNKNIQKFE